METRQDISMNGASEAQTEFGLNCRQRRIEDVTKLAEWNPEKKELLEEYLDWCDSHNLAYWWIGCSRTLTIAHIEHWADKNGTVL